ncbi:unnamed protein product [Paramecium sonneborni]|uniref:Uncharacterized protein n=1 Tax=Paramecium sonneborni TaxID=65129 RepID=A0A8S1K2X4_9CILI|nr:unnamed protein product [Paramecium sonneborni]
MIKNVFFEQLFINDATVNIGNDCLKLQIDQRIDIIIAIDLGQSQRIRIIQKVGVRSNIKQYLRRIQQIIMMQ